MLETPKPLMPIMKLLLRSSFALIFLFSFYSNAGAQELSPERKVYAIKNLQHDLTRLPYESDYITGTLIPETQAERVVLAPHYPDIATLERDQTIIDQAFLSWVATYPNEYEAYKSYLEAFLRSHVNP